MTGGLPMTRSLSEIPFLVVDVETTGAGEARRVIEVACALVHGERPPRVVFETLVDPQGAIDNHEVHGITDDMVEGAPTIAALIDGLAALMANRVLVAHGAAFDRAALVDAWGRHGRLLHAPWLCTLRLPSLVGFGPGQLPLWWACERHGVPYPDDRRHMAATDALATARLLRVYLDRLAALGVTSLDALAARIRHGGAADVAEQLGFGPLPAPARLMAGSSVALCPREPPAPRPARPLQRYLDATVAVLDDLIVDDEERAHLARLRGALGISSAAAERVYAKIWSGAMARYREDGVIDSAEARHIAALRAGFGRLGWTPPR